MAMQDPITAYKKRLHLEKAHFTPIDHEEAMVAAVFKITQSASPDLVLKVCPQKSYFLKEAYFLSHFAGKIPLPRLIALVKPEEDLDGALLMDYIEGFLLKKEAITQALAWEVGSLLARIHGERAKGYGDLTDPLQLSQDPRVPFHLKFKEGLEECKGHLPEDLLDCCQHHFDKDIDLLLTADGPCIIHRDFRPGNLIVAEGKVKGIIDWSSARGGFAEDDLCPLEFGEWSQDPTCKKAFLEGYGSIRKVPAYKAMIPLLRLSRAIAAIGFTVKRGIWASKGSKLYQFSRLYLESLVQ